MGHDDGYRDPYLFPGATVLRNRRGLRDPTRLNRFERLIVTQRLIEGSPSGDFDIVHLQAIHRHLFQDVYDWAGEIRTVEITKGGQTFQFRSSIQTGMADVHRRLVLSDFLRGLTADEFAVQAGHILGDVNYVHPFREGNGRTQLQYLSQLTAQAGHEIDLSILNRVQGRWIDASKVAMEAEYAPMVQMIRAAII